MAERGARDAADLERWLARLEADPTDDDARVVFSDLAREWGDDQLAEWLRLEMLHARGRLPGDEALRFTRLGATLPPDVRARLGRAEIERCAGEARSLVPLSFACPVRWERMARTDDPRVRVCGACVERVHWVETVEEYRTHAAAGDCVAVAPGLQRPPSPAPLPAGEPRPFPDLLPPPGSVAPPWPPGGGPDRPVAEPPRTAIPWWRRLFGG